jgi:L-ascorbate metabolism protein UlaG (beta-lactamase superfamily)
MSKMLRDFLNKPKTTVPQVALPSVKTDLRHLPDEAPVIVWFGHSSYLIRHQGISVLVDPVFSGNASPVAFFGKSFPGSDVYSPGDFGNIDMLIITHDHYDHLDYKTITQLQPKIKHFYTGLGVGAHLEYWGVPAAKITELDWWETYKDDDQTALIAAPARHFSGRGFKRNQTIWSSFILKLNGYTLFVGGDSGYDSTFKTVGEKYGPFDIAMLEAGQYGDDWPYIHMLPEQTVQASIDLKAKVLLPVHWGKFALAYHEWNEPIRRVVRSAAEKGVQLTTPKIGEPVVLGQQYPNSQWWNF